MVPHLWIKEWLDMFGVAEIIKTLLVNKSELGEVDTKQGIFQGDF